MVALLNRGVFGTTYSWIFFTTVPNDFYRMDTEKKAGDQMSPAFMN